MNLFKKFLHKTMCIPYENLDDYDKYISYHKVAKNEFLLIPAQINRHLFFVEKGVLRMYTINKNGKESIVQFAIEEMFICDRRSFYYGTPSNFFIQAVDKTEVYYLEKDVIMQVIQQYPAAAMAYNQLLNDSIARMQERISTLLGQTAEERYRDFLNMYQRFANRAPLYMIASYLGITPESLSRVRAEMVR